MQQEFKNPDAVLEEIVHNKLATEHSKNAIFMFVIFGIIIFIWKSEAFLSLSTLLFFVVGIFLASLLSIPSYMLKRKLAKYMKNKGRVYQSIVFSFWVFEFFYDFASTYLLFYLYKLVF